MDGKVLKGRAQPLGKYPHYKRVGDFIYISGTSSRLPDNTHAGAKQNEDGSWDLDIAIQTEAVIKNIEAVLQSAGAELSDLVDVISFLVDMKDFPKYNEAYGKYFNHTGPTRTTVAVHQLPHPNLLIEIKAVAYKPLT